MEWRVLLLTSSRCKQLRRGAGEATWSLVWHGNGYERAGEREQAGCARKTPREGNVRIWAERQSCGVCCD